MFRAIEGSHLDSNSREMKANNPEQPHASGEVLWLREHNDFVSVTEENKKQMVASLDRLEEFIVWVVKFIELDGDSGTRLENDWTILREHAKYCATSLVDLANSKLNMKFQAGSLVEEQRKLEMQLKEKEAQLAKLLNTLETLQRQLEITTRNLEESNKESMVSQEEHRKLEEEFGFCEARLAQQDAMKGALHDLREEVKRRADSAVEQDTTNQNLRSQLEEMAQQAKDYQTQLQALRAELVLAKDDLPRQRIIEQLENTIRDKDVALAMREQTIGKLRAAINDRPTMEDYKHVQNENVKLLDKVHDAEKKLSERQEQMADMVKRRNEALKANPERKPATITQPVLVMPKATDVLTEAHRKLEVATKEFSQVKEQRALLRAEKQELEKRARNRLLQQEQ